MRLRSILAGAALCCAAAPAAGAAPSAGYPALDRLLRTLVAIDRDYVSPVDMEAVAARGARAIRDQAQADPAAFATCIAGQPSHSRSGVRGAADTLLDALQCTKTPSEQYDPLVDAALQAMIDGLDPLSHYYGPAELRAALGETDGGNVGLRLSRVERGIVTDRGVAIVGTDPGTPARAAGLREGERLLAVGGTQLAGKSLEQVDVMLWGAVGSEVALTLAAPGRPARSLTLTRVTVGDGSDVETETRDGVLILHVFHFGRSLRAEVGKAIENRPEPLRGVVLDLRSSPGGLLDETVWLADAFLDRGRIVESRGRGKRIQTYHAAKGQALPAVPLVVLVDRETASGAEIVAAALQDNKRATVAGAVTYGVGTVQTLIRVDAERAIRLTTSFQHRADGRRLQDSRIVPDCPTAATGEPAVALAVAIALGDRASCRASPAPAA